MRKDKCDLTLSRGLLLSARSFCSLLIVALILALPSYGYAQNAESHGNDFSMFAGYMLPNGIEHVSEIMGVFGGRYSLSLPVGAIELEGTNTHSEGVDFTTFSASLRQELVLAHGLSGLIYGGPDFHWYIPQGDTQRHSDYGIHVGGAGLMLVTDTLWLRSDLKFMANPGTALYILFGLMFRTAAGN